METVKCDYTMRPFSGEGDVVAWLKKAQLVAKLRKISDLASFIPLHLEGDALALFLQLSETDQEDADKIESALKTAFADDPFTAFQKLCDMRWRGESVDVFANEIRRLAGLAKFQGSGLENICRLRFVNGFPHHVKESLQRMENVDDMEMPALIHHARVLTKSSEEIVAAAGSSVASSPAGPVDDHGRRQFGGGCFVCAGPHLARSCPKREPVTCYKCGERGHISRQCRQGNGAGVSGAPAVTPMKQ